MNDNARPTFDPARLLPYSRGDLPADLLLTDARIVNVFSGEVLPGNIAIAEGRIAGVGDYTHGRKTVSLGGAFVCPGFIDAHVHIESSMLPPHEFARLALPRGTTAVVADPHEIANVHGRAGVRYMLASAATAPLRVIFMLPSCVPATDMESAGATMGPRALATLAGEPGIHGLAEMMNFPGVIHGDPDVMGKLRIGWPRIDGHAPGVMGKPLQAYVQAGITTDHECSALEEAREKLRLGMNIWIREGTAARNLDALLPLVTDANAHQFAFCTDDRHPDDLLEEGHIDHVIRRAIAGGLNPVTAIRMATINVARHYGRSDLGAIAPGRRADLLVFDDLNAPLPRQVYLDGARVAEGGALTGGVFDAPPEQPAIAMQLPDDLDERSFAIPAPAGGKACEIRVIGLTNAQLLTSDLRDKPTIENGHMVADPTRDLLKLAVVERHHGTGQIGLGFVRGFGLKRGALGSTVAHDSHNLLIVGANDVDMAVAARAIGQAGGGLAVVADGEVLALLPLRIAGLMSDRPYGEVVAAQAALRKAAQSLGCPMRDPFMPLSFLSLPVIPTLKLTDRGLVDVNEFRHVPLVCG